MTVALLASSPAVAAFARTLLHSSWQGVLIAAALWLLLQALPRARSSTRYAASCVALAAMPLASTVTFWRSFVAEPALGAGVGLAAPSGYIGLVSSAAWALGCATMVTRMALGLTHLQRVVKRAGVIDGPWQGRVAELARRVGLRRPAQLLGSVEVDAPLLIGWLKPTILVPLGTLTALPTAYLEALLLHELAHARRLDYLVNLLQSCVEALLFYHPAVHWMSACVRAEREHCCDDVAVAMTGDRLGYARALEAMETWRAPAPSPALAANGGSLRLRIERIVFANAPAGRGRPGALAAASLLSAALGLATIGAWSGADADGSSAPHARAANAGPSISWLPPALERWKPALAEAARHHSVDPDLLAIVVLVESMGNPAAHSPMGAIGLMQLMPTTAARIAAVRELDHHSEGRLWEPAYNLDLGAWYLAEQLGAFGAHGDRSVALAAVAYNGGPRRARAYVESESDATLYEETRRYRDLVVGMWKERELAQSSTFAAWHEQWESGR